MARGTPRVPLIGGVAEWFKAPVLKTGVGASPPWVRIPPPPPRRIRLMSTDIDRRAKLPLHTHSSRHRSDARRPSLRDRRTDGRALEKIKTPPQ
jgi:hypothetical protein